MTKTVTATYGSLDTCRNAKDDLVGTGIPQEKIFVDEASKAVKVIVPEPSQPEIFEILNRHKPISVE